jgi:hypothetical protein
MNIRGLLFFAAIIFSSVNLFAQQRPRIVGEQPTAQTKTELASAPATQKQTTPDQAASANKQQSKFAQLRTRINEAHRLFTSRPVLTSATTNTPSIEFITIAALEPATSKIHLVTLPKKLFLTRNAEVRMTTTQNALVTIRVLRANGVNTAVTIFDENGKSFTPLLVQYPIEKNGKFSEIAYYTSVHPALKTPEASAAGKTYLRTTIDMAVKRLREKGKIISPEIISIAEKLCVIEHIDHVRYRSENRAELFAETYMLLAFNEGNTYRYAVSFAGAGGLVQMIPATYRLVRQTHPKVGLIEDFVAGMRNHTNAVQAMLLYMQDTWNDLSSNDDVIYALENKIATQAEIMSAGYNSNPARLPSYLRNGGTNWRTLIPRETQTYLDIYKSFESLVPLPRTAIQKPQNVSR